MNIQPVQYNSVPMQGKTPHESKWNKFKHYLTQKALDVLPERTVKEDKNKLKQWNRVDNCISKPAQNRGILGVTALATQPAIDYYNHRVDEETRTVSRNRTIAKIIAGTVVGMFVVRGPIYDAVAKMTDSKGRKRYSKALIPKAFRKEISKNEKFLTNYRSALSMMLALGAMSITNFVLDAPLTTFLTNRFNEQSERRKKDEK